MTHPVRITAVVGDLVAQPDCEAIVNAANAQLWAGGGVCGAIHRAAGPELEAAAVPLGPIATGQAVITPGFKLPNRWVIHAVGPRYGIDPDPPGLLASAVKHAIALADAHQTRRIALPAISTGIYGYPLAEAARIMVAAAREIAPTLKHVEEVRFVLVSEEARRWFDA